jgi:hypothetical protein
MPRGLAFLVVGNRLMILGVPLASDVGTVAFSVTVKDKFGDTTTQDYTLTINPAPPIVFRSNASPNGALPAGSVGKSYNQVITASGGSGALIVSYQLAPGSSIPKGLKFNTRDGKLTILGKPTATGTVTFFVTAKDKFGDSSTQSYTLTVS